MKKKIATVLQVLVTLGAIGWIIRDPKTRTDMWHAFRQADMAWIALGIFAYGAVEVLGAARWNVLLRVQGIVIPWYRIGAMLMIGILFNPFMPGGTGGDFVKIFYLLKEAPTKKTQALLAVLMDRLVGLIGLIIVAGVIIIWNWSWLTQGQQVPHFDFAWIFSFAKIKLWLGEIPLTTQLLYVLLGILGITIAGLFVTFAITGTGMAQKLPAKFPKRDIFIDLSVAYNSYASAWKASLLAICLSFGVHVCSFMVFYSAARSIGVKVPVFQFCAVMPIINTISSLPISVGGTGVREALFQIFFNTLCNVAKADAAVFSLLGFSMLIFWAIIGGIIYLTYSPSKHAGEAPAGETPVSGVPVVGTPIAGATVTLAEMKKEVLDLEHKIAEGE